jgi:hypothetical protein
VRLSLETVARDGDDVVLRLMAFNDTAKPVELDRRCLVGPNGVVAGEEPWPISLEPPAKDRQQNIVLLNPFCLYGRERTFTVTRPTTFYAYMVSRHGEGLLPDGPAEKKQLVAAAEPLELGPGSRSSA